MTQYSFFVEDEDIAKVPYGCRYGGTGALPAYHLSGHTLLLLHCTMLNKKFNSECIFCFTLRYIQL
jgi:hypothetical protein